MNSTHVITPLPALNDNYIWMITAPEKKLAVIIDPGDANVVHTALAQSSLKLEAILITHHHWDHTQGARELSEKYATPIYGPDHPSLNYCQHKLHEGDELKLAAIGLNFSVLAIPGHTLTHLAYYGQNWLFSGDTLFSAGCGRLFEGTPTQMLASLNRLKALPASTEVYCGHEYTLSNLKFAQKVEPNNPDLLATIRRVTTLRNNHQPTLPSRLSEELRINPFLRCQEASVKEAAQTYCQKNLITEVEVFATIRKWKDETS